MKTFPMFLKMEGRRVVVIGGGEQAAQKARLMLKTEAQIVLVADALEPELQDLVQSGKAELRAANATEGLFENTILCFAATGCKGADAAWHAVAKQAGILVNVVDYPQLCDAMTPSIVDRDPVVVAIGTEGTAPVLGRKIKTQIEQILPPRLGQLAAVAGRLRGAVAARIAQRDRRKFWRWVFTENPSKVFAQGHEARAISMIKDAIARSTVPETAEHGQFSVVNAHGCAPDQMTLRAVKRLQDADVIYFDKAVAPGVLELARRDAERIILGDVLPQRGTLLEYALKRTPDAANAVWLVGRSGAIAHFPNHVANNVIDIEFLQFAQTDFGPPDFAKSKIAG